MTAQSQPASEKGSTFGKVLTFSCLVYVLNDGMLDELFLERRTFVSPASKHVEYKM